MYDLAQGGVAQIAGRERVVRLGNCSEVAHDPTHVTGLFGAPRKELAKPACA
jgi:hypothetical protein